MGDNIRFESREMVNCASGAGVTTTSGDYLCTAPYPSVSLTTANFTGIFSRKFWNVCHSFQMRNLVSVPKNMNYGWTDDCTDGSCAIEIRLDFSGQDILSATASEADQLGVVMHGTVFSDQANPFFDTDQLVIVESVDMSFKKTGKRKAVGTCTWYTDLTGLQAEFWSLDE